MVLLSSGQCATRYSLCRKHGRHYANRLIQAEKNARDADAWLKSFLTNGTPPTPTDEEIMEMFMQTDMHRADLHEQAEEEGLRLLAEAHELMDEQKKRDGVRYMPAASSL